MLERRSFGEAELRAEPDAAPVIAGYAAVFDSMSDDLGGFRERIAGSAFDNTLAADVRALYNHDASVVLGRTKSGTLRLNVDARGLAVEIMPPDTPAVRGIMESLKRGDINQMSFGFRTKGDRWDKQNGEWIRTLLDVDLFDVSLVTYPAYPQTEAALRSLEAARAGETKPGAAQHRARLLRLAQL